MAEPSVGRSSSSVTTVATYESLVPGLRFPTRTSVISVEHVRRYYSACRLPADFGPYRGIVPPLLLNWVHELWRMLGEIPAGVLLTRDVIAIHGVIEPGLRVVSDVSVERRYEKRGRRYVDFAHTVRDGSGRLLLRSTKTWLWTN